MSANGKFVQIAGCGDYDLYALDEYGYVWYLAGVQIGKTHWLRLATRRIVPEESK